MTGVVLVTGASSGIGMETATAAGTAGYQVVATVRDPARTEVLRKSAADAGVDLDVEPLDVTDEDSMRACLETVRTRYGRLDVLVNNAGRANTFATIETCDLRRFRANLEVNFFGVVSMTKFALPLLRASGGRVVTIGATRGLIGQPFNEGYSAAKFAVEGFMESLAPTAARMGVRLVMVVPGPVLGSSFGVNSGVTRESLLAEAGVYAPVLEPYLDWVARQAWPGAQSPAEVAAVVVAAMSDPEPTFRVMTSDWARDYAALKLKDPSGTVIAAMSASWLDEVQG
ncbi:MAG: SDR family NAD(P)-dependent oxidoreductase [Nocardioidaceae bacterium]